MDSVNVIAEFCVSLKKSATDAMIFIENLTDDVLASVFSWYDTDYKVSVSPYEIGDYYVELKAHNCELRCDSKEEAYEIMKDKLKETEEYECQYLYVY